MERNINQLIQHEHNILAISPTAAQAIIVAPVLIAVVFSLAWFVPITHKFALWLSKENHPAEFLTFLFLISGSIVGMHLAWWLKAKGGQMVLCSFIAFFSAALFIVGMEEISWGQQFFRFETPDALLEINEQNEFTFHNIEGLHGNSEYFHLFFGIAGLIGLYFNLYVLNPVRIPHFLASWFIIITITAALDLVIDSIFEGEPLAYFARRLSEINEMLIGMAGFLYLSLLSRKFKKETLLKPRF